MTRPPSPHTIAERMEDCLYRQIEAFERARDDLDRTGIDHDDADAALLALHASHARSVHQLEEELRLLLPEWQGADPPPSPGERAAVSDLATRAQALADDLQQRYAAGHERARAVTVELKSAVDALRASRAPLRYHPGPGEAGQRMDHQA